MLFHVNRTKKCGGVGTGSVWQVGTFRFVEGAGSDICSTHVFKRVTKTGTKLVCKKASCTQEFHKCFDNSVKQPFKFILVRNEARYELVRVQHTTHSIFMGGLMKSTLLYCGAIVLFVMSFVLSRKVKCQLVVHYSFRCACTSVEWKGEYSIHDGVWCFDMQDDVDVVDGLFVSCEIIMSSSRLLVMVLICVGSCMLTPICARHGSTSCLFTDRVMNRTIDLSPLSDHLFTTHDPSSQYTYSLIPCGNIPGDFCGDTEDLPILCQFNAITQNYK